MEDLPTVFDFLDGKEDESFGENDEGDDDFAAFTGEIPSEDFDFAKSHEVYFFSSLPPGHW